MSLNKIKSLAAIVTSFPLLSKFYIESYNVNCHTFEVLKSAPKHAIVHKQICLLAWWTSWETLFWMNPQFHKFSNTLGLIFNTKWDPSSWSYFQNTSSTSQFQMPFLWYWKTLLRISTCECHFCFQGHLLTEHCAWQRPIHLLVDFLVCPWCSSLSI